MKLGKFQVIFFRIKDESDFNLYINNAKFENLKWSYIDRNKIRENTLS